MGAQNTKQTQGYSSVQIDHPKFENAKVYEQKNNIFMQNSMGVEQKDYNKWKSIISNLKVDSEHLLLPKKNDFSTKGLCSSTGTLNISYDYYPYLLIQQIQNRKRRKSKFQECELWFLLYSLSAAQTEMKKTFDIKVGDIRPQNIFINQQGQIKVACMHSWPKETSNFQKTFQHQQTLLAPQDMKKLQLGGMDQPKNFQSEMFSVGMTILSTAMLTDFGSLYDVSKFKFKFQEAKQYLHQWKVNTQYSQIFTAFVSNLCSFEPEKRLTQKQLWSWISKYEQDIKNKDDFVIDHAPLKIQKQIQQLRSRAPIVAHNSVHLQQRPNVIPFAPRQHENMMVPPQHNQNLPKNLAYGNSNIQAAQSLYTNIPLDAHQKHFNYYSSSGSKIQQQQQIPQIPQRVQKQFLAPGVIQNPPGGYVYTRRIIDPNNGGVVAEEQINEDEYQKGTVGSARRISKQEANY